MAKSTRKSVPADQEPAAMDYQSLINSNGENMAVAMKSGEAMVAGMASLTGEMVAFANTRWRENLETSESLAHCKDAEEAFRVQRDHASKMTQQYLDEATKLMQLATKMTREAWSPFEDRTKETLHRLSSD